MSPGPPLEILKPEMLQLAQQVATLEADYKQKSEAANAAFDLWQAAKVQFDNHMFTMRDGFVQALLTNPEAESYAQLGAAMDVAAVEQPPEGEGEEP